MDTQPDRTPAGEAQAAPRQPRHNCTASAGTDAPRYRLAGRSRTDPTPWWLTREPTRWDQARMHCTCAALHAREVARELWRALYACACADRWPRRWWAGVIAAALVLACCALLSGCQWIGRTPAPGPATATGARTPAATLASAAGAAGEARSAASDAASKQASRVASDVDAAHAAVTADPPRLPDASAALTVAKGHLADVVRDPQEAQALASAERSRASGDASGADAAILALTAQARTDAAELTVLRQRATQAERDRDTAQAALIREGEQGAARLADALDKERRGVLRSQVAKLSWIGIACCAGAALAYLLEMVDRRAVG